MDVRHYAIQNGWPRRSGMDKVLRYDLPPRQALAYVLRNAQHQPSPRDAVLLVQPLEVAETLEPDLAEAGATIQALHDTIDTLVQGHTDAAVHALRSGAAVLRSFITTSSGEVRIVA